MKTILFLAASVLFILGSGCRKDKKVNVFHPLNSDSCMVMDTLPLRDTTAYNDPFTIKTASVSGDYLKLSVNYGGGCKNHSFRLVWNQYFIGPQLSIHMEHNANGDQCKALVTSSLCFNISRLKKNVNTAHGQIGIPLSDGAGNTFYLQYTF